MTFIPPPTAPAPPPPFSAPARVPFFAIFDGHGGRNVADYAAAHLHGEALAAGLAAEAERAAAAPAASAKACRAAVAEGFRRLDARVLGECAARGWGDGATAVALWVVEGLALVANVGDAKAVLARRPEAPAAAADPPASEPPAAVAEPSQGAAAGAPAAEGPPPAAAGGPGTAAGPREAQAQAGAVPPGLKAVTLTREHKAIYERARIEAAGGFVSADGRLGGWCPLLIGTFAEPTPAACQQQKKVSLTGCPTSSPPAAPPARCSRAGRVEVSRALGDRQFKGRGRGGGMVAVPDVTAFALGPRDAFALLGCDGFWGVFGAQDAVDFAAAELWGRGKDAKQVCNRLVHEAIRERRCADNCTVMLVFFGPAAAD